MFCAETLGRKAMDRDSIAKRVRDEEDYVRCPKCSNSLAKFLAKNSEGVENSVIARLLMIPEEKVEEIYQEAVQQLRAEMVEKDDDGSSKANSS